jgi:tetratricopeptide (TPR) repeat protein
VSGRPDSTPSQLALPFDIPEVIDPDDIPVTRISHVLNFAFPSLFGAPAMSSIDHSESLLTSAQDAYSARDFARAWALCTEALDLSPTNPKARLLRALVSQAAQNHTDAIEDLSEILAAAHPKSVSSAALYSRANSFYTLRQFAAAAADCQAALEMDPDHADARYLHCISLKALGDFEQAIDEATRLIDAHPTHREAIYARATLRHMNSDWPGAVADFTTFLANPTASLVFEHNAYFFRGISHHHLNAHDLALTDLNQALLIQPENPTTLARRAVVYSALGLAENAAADIQRCQGLLKSQSTD